MADHFGMDSAEMGAVFEGLAGLGARMSGHVSVLGPQFASAGEPWGSDTTGDQFAGGADGFVAYIHQCLQTMGAHAETVQRCADELAAHHGDFVQADQA